MADKSWTNTIITSLSWLYVSVADSQCQPATSYFFGLWPVATGHGSGHQELLLFDFGQVRAWRLLCNHRHPVRVLASVVRLAAGFLIWLMSWATDATFKWLEFARICYTGLGNIELSQLSISTIIESWQQKTRKISWGVMTNITV